MEQTFRDTDEEVQYFRHAQVSRYTHVYSISFQIPMVVIPSTIPIFADAILHVMEDADFHITHVTGSATSPVDSNGKRLINGESDTPINFPMAASSNRGDRGISFKFIDPKPNRRLTEAQITRNAVDLAALATAGSNIDRTYLEFGAIFPPGYDFRFGRPTPFEYYLTRNDRFKVRIQSYGTNNSEIISGAFQRVSLAFIGNRYAT